MFNVQVTDIPESDLQADEKNKEDEIPVQFRHHEILFDAKPIPNLGKNCTIYVYKNVLKPLKSLAVHTSHIEGEYNLFFLWTGIQTAVRMLEQKLGNLNVYRDSKPKVDCIQRQYRRRKKKVLASVKSSSFMVSVGWKSWEWQQRMLF